MLQGVGFQYLFREVPHATQCGQKKKRKDRYCRQNRTYLHEPGATILENEVEASEGTCSWSGESRLWKKLEVES